MASSVSNGTIKIVADQLVIDATPHVAIRLRRLFGGAQRYRAGVFTLAATPERAHDLQWFATNRRHRLDIDPDSRAKFDELVAAQERKLDAIETMESAAYVPREFELALPPRDYQRVAADLALRTGNLLIADDLGVGKTASAICALAAPGALPAVVVTLKHLVLQWERELARFAPALRVHRLRSTTPYEFSDVRLERDPVTRRRRVVKHDGIPDVVLLNYAKLNGWADVLARHAKTFIADEAQEFRRKDTAKYDAGLALARAVELRIGLTATPIYGYGHEIYHVMEVIAPGQLGTWKEFLDEWCGGSTDDKGRATVHDPAALGTYLRQAGLMVRRTRKDVGREIPDLTIVRHEVECDQRAIDSVADDVAELARRIIDRLGSPLDRLQDARDIDYQLRQATGIGKAGATVEFVRMLVDSGERVLLGGWHHAVYDLWCSAFDRLGIPYVKFTGKESENQKDEARRQFIAGKAKVLIMSNRAGAGLDGLQFCCRTAVIGELDWSPQVIQQFIGRIHRDGQPDKVVAYLLTTASGSDPVIEDALGIKGAQSHYMLNPTASGMPELQGAAEGHIRKLAEDVLRRRGRAA